MSRNEFVWCVKGRGRERERESQVDRQSLLIINDCMHILIWHSHNSNCNRNQFVRSFVYYVILLHSVWPYYFAELLPLSISSVAQFWFCTFDRCRWWWWLNLKVDFCLARLIYVLKLFYLSRPLDSSASLFEVVRCWRWWWRSTQYHLTIYAYKPCALSSAFQFRQRDQRAVNVRKTKQNITIQNENSKDSPCCYLFFFRFVYFLFFCCELVFGPSFYLWWMVEKKEKRLLPNNSKPFPWCMKTETKKKRTKRIKQRENEWNELIGHWEFLTLFVYIFFSRTRINIYVFCAVFLYMFISLPFF